MSIAEKFETIADAVYEKAQKNTTDDFIKRFTNNGARTNYTYGFCSTDFSGFTIEATPKRIGSMFSYYEGETIPDGIDCSNAEGGMDTPEGIFARIEEVVAPLLNNL